jgi:hypothetical protein
MKIDLTGIPLIDNHAHPFPSGRALNRTYERSFTLSRLPVSPVNIHNTLFFQMLNDKLREVLGLSPDSSISDIVKIRDELLKKDRQAYIDMLWKQVGYMGMVADIGSPVTKQLLTKEELAEFDSEMKNYVVRKVNRIEWVAEDVVESGTHSFEEFTDLYVKGIKQRVKDQGLVGLKSIIAYKTGLDIKVSSDSESRRAYYLYLSDPKNREYEKAFRDYCFCKGCEVAAELDLPLQIHTALGDTPTLNLYKCNPLLLYDAINAFPKTRFVLLHAGYPYCEELGYLVWSYDNVYADMSSMHPYASIAGETKIKSIIELAPMNKIMFGTDAGGIPEQFWFGALEFRTYLTNVLQELVDKKYISHGFAIQSAENIMYKNVLRLYKINGVVDSKELLLE